MSKRKKPKGYDSFEEYNAHRTCLSALIRNTEDRIPFSIDTNYEPDFYVPGEPNILVEFKGRFRTAEEAAKYVHFKKQHPQYDIIFVFQNPTTRMPNSKKRKKCGTYFTVSEWADKHGFKWYSVYNTPKNWSK